jgi:hypothetical protein
MDPRRRLALAHRALAPGGVLALFGHYYDFADAGMRDETDAVYRRLAPELADPLHEHLSTIPEPHASPLFTDPRNGTFTGTVRYPTARYLSLLRTFSNHRMLPEDRRAALHGGLAAVVDAHGGALDIRVGTELILARRAA